MTFLVWFQLNFLTFFLMCSTYFNFDFFFIHLKRNMKSGDRSKGGCDCCNNILDEAVVYPTLTGRHFFARFDFVLRYFCFVCVWGSFIRWVGWYLCEESNRVAGLVNESSVPIKCWTV